MCKSYRSFFCYKHLKEIKEQLATLLESINYVSLGRSRSTLAYISDAKPVFAIVDQTKRKRKFLNFGVPIVWKDAKVILSIVIFDRLQKRRRFSIRRNLFLSTVIDIYGFCVGTEVLQE